MSPLRIAIIGGPQYDQIRPVIDAFTAQYSMPVDVGFRGDHVSLNSHLADAATRGSYDLVSTHSKYVPSQQHWLTPLDDIVSGTELDAFQSAALKLCRVNGQQLCLPRNIDARLLFVNRELIDDDWLPSSWEQVVEAATRSASNSGRAGFAFPTRDSGLFGTFYEIVAAYGGALFDDRGEAQFTTPESAAALELLVRAAGRAGLGRAGLGRAGVAPLRMVEERWYFDEVSYAFRSGQVAMVGDWPGYYALLKSSAAMHNRVRVTRYPLGTDGRRHVYAGCHAWAIPVTARDPAASAGLLMHLLSAQAATVDAAAGLFPAQLDIALASNDALDIERAEMLTATVATDLLTFPPMPSFPAIEDASAACLRAALLGECSVSQALVAARVAAQAAGRVAAHSAHRR